MIDAVDARNYISLHSRQRILKGWERWNEKVHTGNRLHRVYTFDVFEDDSDDGNVLGLLPRYYTAQIHTVPMYFHCHT